MSKTSALLQSLERRFGKIDHDIPVTSQTLQQMADRGSCREFNDETVDPKVIQTLCAVALASPTKSDLQQRDIVMVSDAVVRREVNQLLGQNNWEASAPVLLVFCGNNRRQRQISQWNDIPFNNDHLDAFFNASVDALSLIHI